MHQVTFNLLRPIGRLEAQRNRRYEYAEIAHLSGLSRQTVRNIMRKSPKQIDVDTLSRLLTFFAAEGMAIGVGDMFDVISPPPDKTQSP